MTDSTRQRQLDIFPPLSEPPGDTGRPDIPEAAGPTQYNSLSGLSDEQKDVLLQYIYESEIETLLARRAYDVDQQRVRDEIERRRAEGDEYGSFTAVSVALGQHENTLASALHRNTRVGRQRHYWSLLQDAMNLLGLESTIEGTHAA